MWPFVARQSRRTPSAAFGHNAFRPRVEAMEDRCLMSAGVLDPTFSADGLVKSSLAWANDVAIQKDGKIVIAGHGSGALTSPSVQRYNVDGSVDTSFAPSGGKQALTYSFGLAIQSDGKIVVVGQAGYSSQDFGFGIVRYNTNGSLDTSFGNKGVVVTNTGVASKSQGGGNEAAYDVAIQNDGKIVVAGWSQQGTGPSEFTAVRYSPNGALDTSFGGAGIVKSGTGLAAAVDIAPDDKVVVSGRLNDGAAGAAVVRYNSNGSLDLSFGVGGKAAFPVTPDNTTFFNAYGGAIFQSGGAIVVAGWSQDSTGVQKQTLARLTSSGQIDATFGNLGYAINSRLAQGLAIAQTANGVLLAAGADSAHSKFGVAAYLPNGQPDTTFGNSGTALASFGDGTSGDIFGQALQADGKIVVAGDTQPSGGGTYNGLLARFQAPTNTFTASPNPVTAGSSVTLYASNLVAANLTGPITQVAFYLDSNGNGTLEPGTDTLLGYGAVNAIDVWTKSFTAPLTKGPFKLFAQAMDSSGVFSDPLTLSLVVL